MSYDLVIRNGTVVDGSGLAARRADVAVLGDRIVEIGRVDGKGRVEVDAEGHVVTPGFIDGHTHMDAQVFWDSLGTNSCWHGVTSVVMGNCGFTLAPARAAAHDLVLANLEKAEDIPAEVMAAGINWTWESFPEYMAAVDATPKAINYGTQIGHSALRTWAMGERAFEHPADADDVRQMSTALREALKAGAMGFTTSLSDHHETPDGRPVASRACSWEELSELVEVVGNAGSGVFELALDTESVESADVETAQTAYDALLGLAVRTRVPVTFGLRRQHLQTQLDLFETAAKAGATMFGQCQSTTATTLFSFFGHMPVDRLREWSELRVLPVTQQRAALQDPVVRARLAAADGIASTALERLVVFGGESGRPESLRHIAQQARTSLTEAAIDLALKTDMRQLFGVQMTAAEEDAVLIAMRHPRTVMTFSDSGAHVRIISGGDLQTTLLAHWVREREKFNLSEAVRMITLEPARAWGLRDRGLVREGMIADINVFDPATVAPGAPVLVDDLPSGATRISQKAEGFLSTIVAGREVFRAGEHTGELPGALLRR